MNPNITFFKRGITITDQSNTVEAYKNISIEEPSGQDSYHLENSKENDEHNNVEEFDEDIFEHEYPILEEGTCIEILQLDRPKSLEELLQLAEQTRIIGEDPQLHWSKNKILAKLDIINSDLTIKTADMPCSLIDKQEFE